MRFLTFSLVAFVILFHVGAFVLESLLWIQPFVHEPILEKLRLGVNVSQYDQALILKKLFLNQGFYNLFLAFGGVAGLVLMGHGHSMAGKALVLYMCLFAVGAGLVLLFSVQAFTGAFLQGGVAALAALMVAFGGLKKV